MKGSIVALAVVALGISTGCKKGPVLHVKDPGIVKLPSGWKLAESPDKTVSIGVAPGWGKGMADSLSVADLTGMAGGELPTHVAQEQERALDEQYNEEVAAAEKKDGIIISVVDRQTRPIPGEQRTRYVVKRREMDAGVTLEQAADAVKTDLAGKEAPKKVTLPIGPAIRYDAAANQRDGSTVTKIMYVVVDGANAYTVTFTTQGAPTAISSIAEPVMQTLRIKPSADK
jgi:hypothetical protein